MAAGGHEVSFTVRDGPSPKADAATSLLIPLPALSRQDIGGSLVLYATTPGALVDLAAGLDYVLHLDPAAILLDGHLSPPTPESGIAGLVAHTAINQAIGVLIDRGHTPESAHAELRRRATTDSGDLHGAEQVLHDITGPAP